MKTNKKDPERLAELNLRLAKVNAQSADIMADLEQKNDNLNLLNKKLAEANAYSSTLLVELEEKNMVLTRLNKELARANVHGAELLAMLELKESEIKKLNKELSRINARGADLVAEREIQMEEIQALNRKLKKEIKTRLETEEELRDANATKDRFFSIIAHDLKNPFNSIVDLVTIITEDSEMLSKDEIVELIKDLHGNAKKTKVLLDSLLQWRQVQSGGMLVNPEELNLQEITDQTIEVLSTHANAKGISLLTEIEEDCCAFGDKNMITTVIRNLISNAIKFTPQDGTISVSVSEKEGFFVLHVKDNGMGMSEENVHNLFKIDKKVSAIGTANEKGSGLGLILCKEFVEKNGGKIWAFSKLNQGSVFSFMIPKAKK